MKLLAEPRPGKKCLVIDIDYTIFDLGSTAERPEVRARASLGTPCRCTTQGECGMRQGNTETRGSVVRCRGVQGPVLEAWNRRVGSSCRAVPMPGSGTRTTGTFACHHGAEHGSLDPHMS